MRREPVGVVGAIVPWNYPQALAAFKLAPALAADHFPVDQTTINAGSIVA